MKEDNKVLERTAAEYRKILEEEPDNWEFYCSLGNLLVILKEYTEAKYCFEKTIELKPDYGHAYFSLANLLMKEDSETSSPSFPVLEKAKTLLEKSLQILHNESYIHAFYASILLYLDEDEKAEEQLNKALKINPKLEYALELKKILEDKESDEDFTE